MKKIYFFMICILAHFGPVLDAHAMSDKDEIAHTGTHEPRQSLPAGKQESHEMAPNATPRASIQAIRAVPTKTARLAEPKFNRVAQPPKIRAAEETRSRQSNFTHKHFHRHIGARRHHLPSFYRRIDFLDRTYFYNDGFFYVDGAAGYYEIVQPPIGAVIAELPAGAVQIAVGTDIYYMYENVFYKQVPEGYQVVSKPY